MQIKKNAKKQIKKEEGKKSNYIINYIIHFLVILTFYVVLKKLFILKYSEDMNKFNWVFDYLSPLMGIFVIMINLSYFILYYFQFPFVEKMKINKLKWPWEENKNNFKKLLPDIILLYIMNQGFIANIFLLCFHNLIDTNYTLETIPNIFQFWLGIIISMLIEDFFFYWGHRFLHHPLFYNKIHKIHHRFYNVIHISYAYAHPLEYLFGNILPNFFTIMILGKYVHFITYVGFVFVRLMETCEGHSGYEFEYSMFAGFPWMTDSSYHNYHHLINRGNYSSMFRIWDTLFKTNKDWLEYDKKNGLIK